MKILLTAFDPFGEERINPAQEALKQIQAPDDHTELIKLVVPTVFGLSIQTVYEAIKKHHPDIVLSIGQAGGRSAITVEQVAINLMDASIPDNKGNAPAGIPIFPDGADGYFSTLPVKEIAAAICQAGIPAAVSYSAGTFVCNQLMYGVLYYTHQEFQGTRAGFIHVPYIPQQAAALNRPAPSMSLEDIVQGIQAALKILS